MTAKTAWDVTWALCSLQLACCPAFAQVNRCVGADGRVEYRSQPCQNNASATPLPIAPSTKTQAPPQPFGEIKRLEPAPISRPLVTEADRPDFGKPVQPLNLPQKALITRAPPRELASSAEVAVVSGYEGSSAVTRVVVNRPGKQVLLVLSSYEKMLWRVDAMPGTSIKGILVSSYENRSALSAEPEIPGYQIRLPYAYDVNNVQFTNLLSQLHELFGVTKIDAHKGRYRLPATIELASLDAPRAELTLSGEQAQAPNHVFEFELVGNNFSKVLYRNTGPATKPPGQAAVIADGPVVLSGSGREVYSLLNDALLRKDRSSGRTEVVPLPASFPSFSWATDLAYDTQQDIVSIVTHGGEGFLYRYDAKRQQWLDYRSLKNIDIASLAYDPQDKRYVAWTSDGDLLFISNQGRALGSKSLRKQLLGFGRLYDGNNGSPPRLLLAPRGNSIALLHVSQGKITHIWTYDEGSGSVQLTYKERGNLP